MSIGATCARTDDMLGRQALLPSVAFILCTLASPLLATIAHAEPPPASAFAGRWEKLGERTVEARLDKDIVPVGRDDGLFSAIQIKVENSALVLYELKVVFGNGETFEPKLQLVFNKDTSSRVIDLPGDKRVIKRIEFKYRDLPGGGKARVEVWGKDMTPPPAFQRLGERTVNGTNDKDVIEVGSDDGFFTAIQIKVEASSLAMYDIKVVFGNGESFSPSTRLVFDKNTSTRLIDLPGNKRIIKRVEFRYGNIGADKKNARVELWGKR
jgi:hypothetical protein